VKTFGVILKTTLNKILSLHGSSVCIYRYDIMITWSSPQTFHCCRIVTYLSFSVKFTSLACSKFVGDSSGPRPQKVCQPLAYRQAVHSAQWTCHHNNSISTSQRYSNRNKQLTSAGKEPANDGRLLRFWRPITIVAGDWACPVDSTRPTGKGLCTFFTESLLLFCKQHGTQHNHTQLGPESYDRDLRYRCGPLNMKIS